MKKSLILIFIICLSVSSFAQVQTWRPNYVKNNFRDSTLFVKDVNMTGPLRVSGTFKIGAVTITTNGTELNLLDGLLTTTAELNTLVGTTSNIQSQINAKAPITNPGLIGIARLNTDTLATKAYVRSYGGGGAAIWGSITGTLSGQTDLNNALAAKTTISAVRTEIQDSINALIAGGVPIGQVTMVWADTIDKIFTHTAAQTLLGSGSGAGKFFVLSGKVGQTGFPGVGDSLLTHTNFPGKHLTVIRAGEIKQQHANNNSENGYWFDNVTGTITFRPVLTSNEQLEIWAANSIQWESLTAEGGGGGASDLLTGLLAFWKLDETSGTSSAESVGGYNATTTGTVGEVGKIGMAVKYTGTQGSQVSHNAALVPSGDALTVGMWIKINTLPSVLGYQSSLMSFKHSASPWNSMEILLDTNNKLYFYIYNSSSTSYSVYSTDAFDSGDLNTWIHVAATCEGTGQALKMYVNGADVTATADTFTGTFYQHDSGLSFGNEYNGGTNAFEGWIDMPFIHNVALSAAQLLELKEKTHPFN